MSRRKTIVLAFILLFFAGSYLANDVVQKIVVPENNQQKGKRPRSVTFNDYHRIISLSPSITETLYALGLGDRVIGVTRFCNYPPEAREKENVGGFVDPNYEKMAALKPDLVMLLPEHENIQTYLDELGLRFLVVHNRRINEILDTITTIGRVCGTENTAREMVSEIKSRICEIRDRTAGKKRPRVMISIGRTIGSGSIKDVYIAGKNTFYDELVTYTGGINVYNRHDIAYPLISLEGILHLNPEVVIEMVPNLDEKGLNKTMIIKEWQIASNVAAVKTKNIHIFDMDYTVIPGPRFILLLEDFARVLHPEIEWNEYRYQF